MCAWLKKALSLMPFCYNLIGGINHSFNPFYSFIWKSRAYTNTHAKNRTMSFMKLLRLDLLLFFFLLFWVIDIHETRRRDILQPMRDLRKTWLLWHLFPALRYEIGLLSRSWGLWLHPFILLRRKLLPYFFLSAFNPCRDQFLFSLCML